MTKLLNHISDAEVRFYSIGGDGYERRWSFYGLQFVRRVEDQRWSPHYMERGDVTEVEAMHDLTELICHEVVQGDNQVDSQLFDWRHTDKNPLWDHDSIGMNIFKAERLMQFYTSA
jgi:hypothetical protein